MWVNKQPVRTQEQCRSIAREDDKAKGYGNKKHKILFQKLFVHSTIKLDTGTDIHTILRTEYSMKFIVQKSLLKMVENFYFVGARYFSFNFEICH